MTSMPTRASATRGTSKKNTTRRCTSRLKATASIQTPPSPYVSLTLLDAHSVIKLHIRGSQIGLKCVFRGYTPTSSLVCDGAIIL